MSTPVSNDLTGKLKATDLLVESIKSILTISIILISGLLAYIGTVGKGQLCWQNISALTFLFIACILSIININSLLNKVYRSEFDAVMNAGVKKIYIALSLSLLLGLGFGSLYILTCARCSNSGVIKSTDQMVIQQGAISIPDNFSTTVKIEQESGDVKVVTINETKANKTAQMRSNQQ